MSEEGVSQEEQQQPTRRKKRWLLWTLALLVLLPLVLLIAGYGLLRSSLLHSHIWPRLQPVIAEQTGFQVELGDLRIDLLRQVQLKDLRLTPLQPQAALCKDLQLRFDLFELNFDLQALFSQKLQVDRLVLEELAVQGCLRLALPETAKDPEPSVPPADLKQQITDLLARLENPPLAIHLEQLQLKNLQADLQLQLPEQQLRIQWAGQADMDASLHWTQSNLTGELNTHWQSLAPMQLEQAGGQQVELYFSPQFSGQLGWQLDASQKQLELYPFNLDLQLDELALAVETGEQQTLDISALNYQLGFEQDSPVTLQLQNNWLVQMQTQVLSRLNQGQVQLTATEFNLESFFEHQLSLAAQGELDFLHPDWTQLQLQGNATQQLKKLAFLTPEQQLELEHFVFNLEGRLAAGQGQVDLQLPIKQLYTPALLQAVDLYPHLQLAWQQDGSTAELSSQVQLDELPLVDFKLQVDNRQNELAIHPNLTLKLPLVLQDYFTEAQALQALGSVTLTLAGQSLWQHGQEQLLQADFSRWPWGEISNHLQLELAQWQPPATPEGLHLKHPLHLDFRQQSRLAKRYHSVNLQLGSEGLKHPPLLSPLPFALKMQLSGDEDLTQLASQGSLNLAQADFLNWSVNLENQPQQAHFQGEIKLQAQPEWAAFIAEMAQLQPFGPLALEQQLDLVVEHPKNSVLDWDFSALDLDSWQAKAHLDTDLEQRAPPANAKLKLFEPLRLQQQLHWQPESAQLEGRLRLPKAEFLKNGRLEGFDLNYKLVADSGLQPQNAQVQVHLKQARLALQEQLQLQGLDLHLDLQSPLGPQVFTPAIQLQAQADDLQLWLPENAPLQLAGLVFPLTLSSQADLDLAQEQLDLHQLRFSLGDEWLTQELEGKADFAGQNLLLEGVSQITLRDALFDPVTGPMQGSGQLRLPWSISLVEQQQLTLDARAEFQDFSLTLPQLAIQEAQGPVSIREQLQLMPEQKLRFAYVLQADAFQRVDFNRIEPWLEGRQNFSLQSLRLNELQLGPLQATLPIQQNLIRLQDFSLSALGGEVTGQFYLDINPEAWRLGLLGRVSRIDLRQLLPETLATSQYAPVNARTALEFDFSQRLVEGRVDLTDINRTQLLQLLDILDPDHQDPQLATARAALRLAHPRWVRAEMQNSLMDLTLSLSLLEEPLRVRNLPLSPLIERFAEEALKLPANLPLEATP